MSHRSSIPGCGVTVEIVSNIPEDSQGAEDREALARMAANVDNAGSADAEEYIEKYLRSVLAVENILTLDRLRQAVSPLGRLHRCLYMLEERKPRLPQFRKNSPVKCSSSYIHVLASPCPPEASEMKNRRASAPPKVIKVSRSTPANRSRRGVGPRKNLKRKCLSMPGTDCRQSEKAFPAGGMGQLSVSLSPINEKQKTMRPFLPRSYARSIS